MFTNNINILSKYIRPQYSNTHSTQKDSLVHTISSTIYPPLITSVTHRGEWNLGKVLDIYWR